MNQPLPKKINLFPLYLNIFIAFIGVSISTLIFITITLNEAQSPLAADYSLAYRTYLYGLLISAYPLGQLIGCPIIGALSDRYGRRRLLLFTLAASVIAYTIISLSLEQICLIPLGIALFFSGLCEGNISITQGAIADTATGAKRAARFGYITVTTSLAFTIGPTIGGVLSDSNLVSWFTPSTPYWLVTCLLAILFIWIWLNFRETHEENERAEVDIFQALTNLKNVFTDKKLRPFYLLNFLSYLSLVGFLRFIPMYVTNVFHLDSSELSWVIAYLCIPIVIVNGWAYKKLVKKLSALHIMTASLFLFAIGNLIVASFPYRPTIWFTLFFTAIFLPFSLTSAMMIISERASKQNQGGAMGNNLSVTLSVQVVIGSIGAWLSNLNFNYPLYFIAAMALVSALYSGYIHRKGHH